jgi:tellurite resistance protein TerC
MSITAVRPMYWAIFGAVVLLSLLLDRAVFGGPKPRVSFREALIRSVFFVVVGLGFGGVIWVAEDGNLNAVFTYLLAYVVEESLSVDNLFVFLVLFTYFRVTEAQQQRVLVWGIAGAIVMRAVFIFLGSELLHRFQWMIFVFGGFLLLTGARLLFKKDEEVNPEDNIALKLARRYLRTTTETNGDKFFVEKEGKRYATPLFLVLVVVEFTDLLFAVDSVPAVLAISNDVFVVYTSNIMAILGLRALYFLLAGMMSRFQYLGTGLAIILILIGAKMVASPYYHVSSLHSLIAIGAVLAIAVIASLAKSAKHSEQR